MKVICKDISAEKLDLTEVKTIISNEFDFSFGGYGVELNKEYIVMGLVLYADSNYLYYLIDTHGKPNWFPCQLFDVVDNSIPENWFMKIFDKNEESQIYSIWGFNELCNDDDFYDLLIERDDATMKIYFERKMEILNRNNII